MYKDPAVVFPGFVTECINYSLANAHTVFLEFLTLLNIFLLMASSLTFLHPSALITVYFSFHISG